MFTSTFIDFAREARLGYKQFEKDADYTFEASNFIGTKTCTVKGFNEVLNRIIAVLVSHKVKLEGDMYDLGEFQIYVDLIRGEIEFHNEDCEIDGGDFGDIPNYIPIVDVVYKLQNPYKILKEDKKRGITYGINKGMLFLEVKNDIQDGGCTFVDTPKNRKKLLQAFETACNDYDKYSI